MMPLSVLGTEMMQQLLAAAIVDQGYCGFKFGVVKNFTGEEPNRIKSPGIYGDCRKVLSDPLLRKMVINRHMAFVREHQNSFDAIAGVETGGIGFAAILADRTQLPYIGVRKVPKGHGDDSYFAGDVELVKGKRVLLVEDMTTTGGSLFKALQTLRTIASCTVEQAIIVFSYDFTLMNRGAERLGVQIHAQCTFRQMLTHASQSGRVDSEYRALIEKWLTDPHDRSWIKPPWKHGGH